MSDPADPCLTAHHDPTPDPDARRLVAVFAGPVACELLVIGARLGFATGLLDPDEGRLGELSRRLSGVQTATTVTDLDELDDRCDVVVTDHHRLELGPVLRDLLGTKARWIGLMGSPRHRGPHVEALRSLGVDQDLIGRVHRPIGLDIGSRTPPEIAVSTLAGLLADRAGRPGGFFAATTPTRVTTPEGGAESEDVVRPRLEARPVHGRATDYDEFEATATRLGPRDVAT